jgi:hypothetical protein
MGKTTAVSVARNFYLYLLGSEMKEKRINY